MAEGTGRKRSTEGEEAQIIHTDEGLVVDTNTGEVLGDASSQTTESILSRGGDLYTESPFDDDQSGFFDDSQVVSMEYSQIKGRAGAESAGRVIGAARAE